MHTEENDHTKSIHTGEKPHNHNIIVLCSIKNPVHKTYPLSNPLIKNELFCPQNLLTTKILQMQFLNLHCSFCSVKMMLIFICEQQLYFSWLWPYSRHTTSFLDLVHVEQFCSMIPLTSLFYA